MDSAMSSSMLRKVIDFAACGMLGIVREDSRATCDVQCTGS